MPDIYMADCSECILASGRPGNHGYYRKTRDWKTYLAHRLAYEDANGPIPPGWQVHHLCENKQCINPAHLVAMLHGDHVRLHGVGGIAAVHAAAVTCAKGHPFDGHNGRFRTCSICRREVLRKYGHPGRKKKRA